MVDILYLAKGRPEFTAESLRLLIANTGWKNLDLTVYTDGGPNVKVPRPPAMVAMITTAHQRLCGPVSIMNDFLLRPGCDIVIKLDNDVIVPPGWLDAALAVMEAHPELDLLGIEPPKSRTPAPWESKAAIRDYPERGLTGTGYARCDFIGGIGLMRRRAFEGRLPMKPHGFNGVGGFTDWQLQHPEVVKGWIVPPLKVFLLDRIPRLPWSDLSKKYIDAGEQRPWTNYRPEDHELWDWWTESAASVSR